MQGYNSEDIAAGHRRDHDPAAAGRLRHHRAVQFSRDDPVLVSAVRHRLRQHRHRQAVGESADDDAEGVPAARRASGCRRASSTSSTAAARWSTRFSIIRTIRAVSFVGSSAVARHVYARGGGIRQARPVPGRRQESRRGPARRRHRVDRRDRRRQRVRLRRPALPGVVARHHRRRRGEAVHRGHSAIRRRSRVTGYGARRRRADGAGHLARKPRAHRELIDAGDRATARGRWSTAASRDSDVSGAATSSGRRSSRGCR